MARTTPGSGLRAALVVAAAASAGAGLVHAAATGSHADTGTLVWLFAACAAAQLGWAAAVVMIPTRTVLFLGVGINGAAVATWFLTRTVGLPVVAELAEPEAIGTPDLVAAALGALAVAATVLAITQPISRRSMSNTWTAMVVVGTVALVIPAMAGGDAHGGHEHLAGSDVHAGGASHAHESGDDGHEHSEIALIAEGDEHGHDDGKHDDGTHDDGTHDDGKHSTGSGSAPHPHPASSSGNPADHPADGHGHPTPPGNASGPQAPHDHPPAAGPGQPPHDHPPTPGPTQPPHAHPPPVNPSGPIVTIDDPRLSAAQQQAAGSLLYTTLQAMAAFPDVRSVEAAGYRSIGDAGTGFEHFVNWSYFYDGIELDPQRIESIVMQVQPGGARVVVSAMYILNLGKSLNTVPEIAGPLTVWHDHKNLCWVPNGEGGMRLSGTTDATGSCARGDNVVTPPMLHVWLAPQACGPFSGIEGLHGDNCGHAH